MAYVIEQGYNYKYQPLPASPMKFQILVIPEFQCQDYLEDDEIDEPDYADDTDEGEYTAEEELYDPHHLYTGIEAQNDKNFWAEVDEQATIGRLDLDDEYELDDDDNTDGYFHTVK